MRHPQVTVPDELSDLAWERCPDWDGRSVVRLSKGPGGWISWKGSPETTVEGRRYCESGQSGWRRLVVSDACLGIENLEIAFLACSDAKQISVWLAIELGSLQTIDSLIDRFGMPPHPIQLDWQLQLGAARESNLLSHMLVSSDGRIVSLCSLEKLFRLTLAQSVPSCPIAGLLPMCIQAIALNAPHAGPLASRRIDEIHAMPSAADSSILFQDSSKERNQAAASVIKPYHRQGLSKKHRTAKLLWLSIALVALAFVVGRSILIKSSSRQLTQNSVESHGELIEAERSSTPESSLTDLSENASAIDLELSSDESIEPEANIQVKASESIHAFLGRLGSVESPTSIDTISFESVEAILKETSNERIVQESLAELASEMPQALPLSKAPFRESLEAPVEEPQNSSELTAPQSPELVETNPAVGDTQDQELLAHSFSVEQAYSKTTVRVPFRPNDRRAVCRARLNIAENLLLEPADTVEMVGRQDMSWTVAMNDDGAILSIFLRSIPAKSWYIATAVHVRLGTEVERPIGPKDATQVCARLQNYLRWLDHHRLIGESMQANRNTRSTATSGLIEIEKQIKAAEKSLHQWLAIEKLVLAFYRQNAFDLQLASSSDKLHPP